MPWCARHRDEECKQAAAGCPNLNGPWSGMRKSVCGFPPASRSYLLEWITFMIYVDRPKS
ncbi:hypothetical protein GOB91_12650 [Sinorhizobium meliloti]|nr:hypothetical protein [Sinorhizobium meliloti]MDW9441295.1 hypothetical protein [Sinorhizobium meliloti]MDW9453696.1 hypothetical protein [Sinorhizobium meliloti]MDW9466599.1 hypothetical protein [Sinorhizobium meliloti]MDW9517931.1 hypothetical protein [Sinorhizobium meliloti]